MVSLLKLAVRWFLKVTGDFIPNSLDMAVSEAAGISSEKLSREGTANGLAAAVMDAE